MNQNRILRGLSCLAILTGLVLAGANATGGAPKKDKGKPKYTNRLAKETSPYLRMHAHNPVDWFPWGEEAFAKAKKEGKLVFLSCGYSSCYWCHVMERESFDNEEVAAILNKWFVAIKVDREERPDIDQIYMTALEVMGKSGGWPMSMFLTADGKPIIGGTYFPRDDRTIDGQVFKGFKSILKTIHEVAKENPKEVNDQADKIAKATAVLLAAPPKAIFAPKLERALVKECVDELRETFDKEYGGFGNPLKGFKGPKFPTPCRLAFLLHEGQRTKANDLTDMVLFTLDKMALGGIYDHVGGGFHRYSTERTWSVPHFEKMLYDNAQLLEVYARAYQLTKKPLYKRVLQETLAYLQREMMSPEGAFYSSQDAETEEEEGRSYVWTSKELEEAFTSKNTLSFIRKVYGADGPPNFEKKYYILHMAKPPAEIAKELGMTEAQLLEKLQIPKLMLFKARAARDQPFLNTVALTSWSGLAVAGFAEAGKALDDPKVIQTAKKAMHFILSKQVTKDGRLLHTYGAAPGQKPKAAVACYLEDYALLVHGLLALNEVTGENRWLNEAEKLTKAMIEHHGDKTSGGYYFTAHDAEKFFARSKDSFDGATPSGNSQALLNLVRLGVKTGVASYLKEAERGFETFAKAMENQPNGLTTMARALSIYLDLQEKAPAAAAGELTLPGQKPKDKLNLDPVKAEVKFTKADDEGKQTITLTLSIDQGWHVYANPVANVELEGADTVVKVSGKGLAKVVKINYPLGKEEKGMFGKYKTYEGSAIITAVVQRAKDSTEPIEVSVRYQACNPNNCLIPKTIKLKVP